MLPWNDSSGSHMGLLDGLKLVSGTGTPGAVAGTVPGTASLTRYTSRSATTPKVTGGAMGYISFGVTAGAGVMFSAGAALSAAGDASGGLGGWPPSSVPGSGSSSSHGPHAGSSANSRTSPGWTISFSGSGTGSGPAYLYFIWPPM